MITVPGPADLPPIDGFWYLATPYTKFAGGLHAAYLAACTEADRFRNVGNYYCPIESTHPIAMATGIDAKDVPFWIEFDKPLMERAAGLVIAKLDGWDKSTGIKEEMEIFRAAGKPVYAYDPAF